jgi:predicted transposase YbfD/YdcC
MAYRMRRPAGGCGATSVSSHLGRPSSTGWKPGRKKAADRVEQDYLDWALADFSSYLAADALYDGPFCVLSIVDNHTFKRVFDQVLERDQAPPQALVTAFFSRFQAALQAKVSDPLTCCHLFVQHHLSGAERRIGDTMQNETRYCISSLAGDARYVLSSVPSHRGIENRLHCVLDVALNEDACRMREGHSAANFAVLRHLALILLRQDKTVKLGVISKLKLAGLDENYLLAPMANA